MLEEHEKVGLPCKCTGLVSWRTPETVKLPKELIVNKLDKGKFFSPDESWFELKSKKEVYVLDRPGLDKFLFDEAKKEGAEVKTERFENFTRSNVHIKVKTSKGVYETKLLIGADGANSLVAQTAGLEIPKNIYVGMQTTAIGDFEQCAELWFGKNIAPNFFAWVVPENENVARIGLAASSTPKVYYEKFLKSRLGHNGLKPDVAGVIRFGVMKDTVADNVMLVGDAACQIKAFSGGGITYGLIGAQVCADAVEKSFEENKFDYEFLKNVYDKEWKKKLVPGINKGMLFRNIHKLPEFQQNLVFRMVKMFGYKVLTTFDFDLLSG
ncbi:MAG: NAD(P)/FAD-dependent oxidoreductase [Candidatus Aenigmarchaeota archaeon]|nr:NAD(P)/FAD-dependent oxidoreductase [Candidatus Aenigmarchaeota archaeon]